MPFKRLFICLCITLNLALLNIAFAQDNKTMAGSIHIIEPSIRITPPNAPVTAGYLTLHNMGNDADRLISVSSSIAERVEIHEMKMDGDVMKMRQLKNGIEIPAGGMSVLKPGGNHLMFMKLTEKIVEGDVHMVILEFEKAGMIEIKFLVKDMRRGGKKIDHSKMKH